MEIKRPSSTTSSVNKTPNPTKTPPAQKETSTPDKKTHQKGAGTGNQTDTTASRSDAVAAYKGKSTFESAKGTPPHQPPADPKQRTNWWKGLTVDQQKQQIAADPKKIGSLDGLPASARDQANREQLNRDITTLESEANAAKNKWLKENEDSLSRSNVSEEIVYMSKAQASEFLPVEKRDQLKNAQVVRDQLARVEKTIDPATQKPIGKAQLLVYDPAFVNGEGRAAISVGDLDKAKNVALSVPGLEANVQGDMGSLTSDALNLYKESRKAGGDVATVAWMGYDAPNYTNVAVDNAAQNGAKLLAADVAGIRASRGGNQPHLTVVGHSYGSTTSSIAADKHNLAADDLVLIGSPGAGDAKSVADYEGIQKGHVWSGSASRDPVTMADSASLGPAFGEPLGLDPSQKSFGANRFRAEAVNRKKEGGSFDDHSKYYAEKSESLYNLANIVTGNYGQVQQAGHRQKETVNWAMVHGAPLQVVVDPETRREPEQVQH
ncbi:alpha/beta hydrolase [Cystobacter ferrugineus]|uniref:DUF1023 domain-containing protein n=1 Tax=Cystobacter ferrugineus TaxID=83449 RepID=A0A1L9BB91_9BACT|nr:alpha/beta hydrolase [Cystobacter ferrugineus]OJH39534.1 hypothetical protein BON30_18740 [Cystobacter ferrugineus]